MLPPQAGRHQIQRLRAARAEVRLHLRVGVHVFPIARCSRRHVHVRAHVVDVLARGAQEVAAPDGEVVGVGGRRERAARREARRLREEARVQRLLRQRLVRGVALAGHHVHRDARSELCEEHVKATQLRARVRGALNLARVLAGAARGDGAVLGLGERAARHNHARHRGGGALVQGRPEVAGEVVQEELQGRGVGRPSVPDAQTRDERDVLAGRRRRGGGGGGGGGGGVFLDRRKRLLRRRRREARLAHLERSVLHHLAPARHDHAGDKLPRVRGGAHELDASAFVLQHERVVIRRKLLRGDRRAKREVLAVLVQDAGLELHVLVQRAHDHALLAFLQVQDLRGRRARPLRLDRELQPGKKQHQALVVELEVLPVDLLVQREALVPVRVRLHRALEGLRGSHLRVRRAHHVRRFGRHGDLDRRGARV